MVPALRMEWGIICILFFLCLHFILKITWNYEIMYFKEQHCRLIQWDVNFTFSNHKRRYIYHQHLQSRCWLPAVWLMGCLFVLLHWQNYTHWCRTYWSKTELCFRTIFVIFYLVYSVWAHFYNLVSILLPGFFLFPLWSTVWYWFESSQCTSYDLHSSCIKAFNVSLLITLIIQKWLLLSDSNGFIQHFSRTHSASHRT